jgi:hypothetical protein
MKWRNNKDFQTLAQNRRNINSLGKFQIKYTIQNLIIFISLNLFFRSNTPTSKTMNLEKKMRKFSQLIEQPIRIPNLTNLYNKIFSVFSCWKKNEFVYLFLGHVNKNVPKAESFYSIKYGSSNITSIIPSNNLFSFMSFQMVF